VILALAQRLAEHIAAELQPYCSRLEIAGSIRRRRPEVGDIDLVCIPKNMGHLTELLNRCAQKATPLKKGDQYAVFTLQNGFQLDLWIAHDGGFGEDPGLFETELKKVPSNWGMLLLARTGSARHNVYLAQVAKQRGLHFNPHRGVLRGKEIVASCTEEEIFSVLGLPFIRPEDRER
jgi:DNA polymerase (family 10)